mmetsp:Transcript_40752/g.100668  ORF Transcript_40752/g.100668 Transcript_40752/m.100668 type:complete len:145 (-) Transcript_40752:172-606(-)
MSQCIIGIRCAMPCLGCLGLNLMDPFKGASFHASHVISFAHSKIVGSSVEDCWNLVPLCGPCNLNIGSTHLIAWFVQKYNNATEEPTMQMMIANALGEVLWRQRRGMVSDRRYLNVLRNFKVNLDLDEMVGAPHPDRRDIIIII